MQELDQGRHGRVRRRNLLAIAAQRAPALAERIPEGFKGRWTRRHWAHASLFATCGALLFALVPGFFPGFFKNPDLLCLLNMKRLAAFIIFQGRTLQVHSLFGCPYSGSIGSRSPPDAVAQTL